MIANVSDTRFSAALGHELRWFVRMSRAPLVRSILQFAEEEIYIPEGKYVGQRFRVKRQPYARHVLEGFETPGVNRFVCAGCVQSGKSFVGLVAPIAYHLYEMKETVIMAAPTKDIAKDKWRNEVEPVFLASPRLSRLLPKSGPGSRGGTPDELSLTNGTALKFMSAGGGDEQRSSYTVRVVVITEVDKMDEASEISRESDPITQLEARTASYGDEKRIYLECTVSIESGRIWQEHQDGSTGELHARHSCGAWVSPGRDHFAGWDLPNVMDARDNAGFFCPSCGEQITPDERKAMVAGCRLIHQGQLINGDGVGLIEGAFPKTQTFSCRWSAFFNLFWTEQFIAGWEHEAWSKRQAEADEDEDFEKRQCQFCWSVPYVPVDYNEFTLSAAQVRKRSSHSYTREIIPRSVHVAPKEVHCRFAKPEKGEDIHQLSMGIDLGKSTCWWVLLAGLEDKRIYVPCYDAFTGSGQHEGNVELAVQNSLECFRDEVIEQGFPIYGTEQVMLPGHVAIDCGWYDKVVYRFLRESGPLVGSRYRALKGFGRSQVKKDKYNHPTAKSNIYRDIGDNWYEKWVTSDLGPPYGTKRCRMTGFNADKWKLWFQQTLVAEPGQAGSTTLYKATSQAASDREHAKISRHWTNEQFKRIEKPDGKGVVEDWEKRGMNHWLDAAAMACVGLDRLGYSLT